MTPEELKKQGLTAHPEFGSGIFEGPPPAEPQPGTPEFGERAKQRALNQSPAALTARSGLTPTPEELAATKELDDTLNPPPPTAVIAGKPGAQLGNVDDLLKAFDVPPPALDALLHDQTPVDESDPEGDIINRLTQSLLSDPEGIAQPRGLTPGEHVALGIMGALDGEIFQNVVLPMLQEERNAPRQAALDMEAQKARRVNALQALATLMSSRRQHEATLQEARVGHRLEAAQMTMQAQEQNANRRLQLLLAQMRDRARNSAAAKVGDRVLGTYTLANIALQNAKRVKTLLDNNVGLFGNEPGGPIAGRLPTFIPGTGGDVRAEISALTGTINEAMLMINQRRGLGKEQLQKIGDALPDIRMGGTKLRKSVENAIRENSLFVSGSEVLHPQLTGIKAQMSTLLQKSAGNPDAMQAIVLNPEEWAAASGFGDMMHSGYENGDRDLGLFRDDSEVP